MTVPEPRAYRGHGEHRFDAVRMPLHHLSQDAGAVVLIPVHTDWAPFGGPETCHWVPLPFHGAVRHGSADTVREELITAEHHNQSYVVGRVTPTGHLVPVRDEDDVLPETVREQAQVAITRLGW